MLLIVSMVLCFIAILLSLVMICYRRRKASWRCAAICTFIFGLFASKVFFKKVFLRNFAGLNESFYPASAIIIVNFGA